jgi:RNA polymerase sigma-70 factor (ECF subfamily)
LRARDTISRLARFRSRAQTDAAHRFEQQFEFLLPVLYRTARALTRHQADAEDLVHDTFVRAHAAHERADLASDAAYRAWLYRIMLNIFRDRSRRRRSSPEISVTDPDNCDAGAVTELAPSWDASPAEIVEQKQFLAAARSAMLELPTEVRVAVALFFVHDLTYREIAAICECSVGTVTSRLTRGRETLRVSLQRFRSSERVRELQPNPVIRELPQRIRGLP